MLGHSQGGVGRGGGGGGVNVLEGAPMANSGFGGLSCPCINVAHPNIVDSVE